MLPTNITNRPSYSLLDAVYQNKNQNVVNVLKTKEGEFSINHAETLGLTPLKGAILFENFNMVELLLQKKADPNATGTEKDYTLQGRNFAARGKYKLYMQMAKAAQNIDWGLPILLTQMSAPIQIAIKINNLPIINLLLHYGAIPEQLDPNHVPESQSFSEASEIVHAEYLKALNEVSTEKRTALALKKEIDSLQVFPQELIQIIADYHTPSCHLIDLPQSSKQFLNKYNPEVSAP